MTKLILGIHHESGKIGRRLLESIRHRFPDIEQEIHHSVDAFQQRLCIPAYDKEKEIVIVLTGKKECLEQLVKLKGCLDGRRLALVLHKEDREMLSKCHLLRPRYVSCEKEQFSDLLSVLEKMINVSGQHDSAAGHEKIRVRERT